MQKRVGIIVLIIFSFTMSVLAQGEGNIWIFGRKAGINFNTNPPSAISNIQVNGRLYNAICDSAGNLLIITNGDTIWDRNWNIMPNGAGLFAKNYAKAEWQPTLILPDLKSDMHYYIVTASFGVGFDKPSMVYSEVDMGLNNGMGDVVKKMRVINPIACIALNATRHSDGKRIWVLSHEIGSNNYIAHLLDTSGFDTNPVKSPIGAVYDSLGKNISLWKLKVSPDGRKVVNVMRINQSAEFLHFDPSNGVFSHWFTLKFHYGTQITQTEFSADGSKLYFHKSNYQSDSVVQLDLSLTDTTAIKNSLKLIVSWPIRDYQIRPAYEMQLGPDGRIYMAYIATLKKHYLGVLSNINGPANQVQFDTAGIDLGNGYSWIYLPLQPTFYLLPQAKFTYSTSCFGDSLKFTGISNRANAKFIWDFGDLSSGSSDTITAQKPTHLYKKAGIYTVKLIVDVNGLRDSISKAISIKSSYFSLGQDTLLCSGTSYKLDANIANGKYIWSTGDTGSFIKVSSGGIYWVKVSGGNCSRYDTLQIRYINPYLNLGKDTSICKDGSIALDAQIDSASYLWSTGANTKRITIVNVGRYSVKVQKGGCSIRDSILINPAPQPNRNTPYHVILCPETGQTDTLDAGIASSYLWWPGKETTRIKIFRDTGIYTLTTSNSNGCIRTDTIVTIRKCPPLVVYPNAFSPNSDSLNNIFLPIGRDVLEYELWIYNRWGERIFHSNAFNLGWDGMYKGTICPEGVYMYKVQYSGYGKPQWTRIFKTGTVNLIR